LTAEAVLAITACITPEERAARQALTLARGPAANASSGCKHYLPMVWASVKGPCNGRFKRF